jgi:hypothetical protein
MAPTSGSSASASRVRGIPGSDGAPGVRAAWRARPSRSRLRSFQSSTTAEQLDQGNSTPAGVNSGIRSRLGRARSTYSSPFGPGTCSKSSIPYSSACAGAPTVRSTRRYQGARRGDARDRRLVRPRLVARDPNAAPTDPLTPICGAPDGRAVATPCQRPSEIASADKAPRTRAGRRRHAPGRVTSHCVRQRSRAGVSDSSGMTTLASPRFLASSF